MWNDSIGEVLLPVTIFFGASSVIVLYYLAIHGSGSILFKTVMIINATTTEIIAYIVLDFKAKQYELSKLSLNRRKNTTTSKVLRMHLDSCRLNGSIVGPFCIMNGHVIRAFIYSIINYTGTLLVTFK